jgi:general secretion pathway protein D
MVGNAPNLFSGNSTPIDTRAVASNSTDKGSDIILPGEGEFGAGQRGGLGGQGGGFGGQGGGLGGQGGGLGGQGGGRGQGGQTNLTAGQGLVPQSIDFITYDPTDNSIIVRGTDEDIAELQRYISMFDVAPKQVVVKVEFITTSSSLAKSLGFDWLYERGTVFTGNRPGSFARAGDPIFLNYATGNVTTRMRALLQDGWGRVVQAPVIRTLNNQPGFVLNQVTTTLFLSQVIVAGNGQIIRAPQAIQVPITSGLGVAPRINEDGTVTTYIAVQLTDFGQLRVGPDGTEFPDILSQSIGVVSRVKSGETIALGGLTRKSDIGSVSRFPILGDLPIIGQFFRSTTHDRTTSELIIFVTPTVIEDESNNGIGP